MAFPEGFTGLFSYSIEHSLYFSLIYTSDGQLLYFLLRTHSMIIVCFFEISFLMTMASLTSEKPLNDNFLNSDIM